MKKLYIILIVLLGMVTAPLSYAVTTDEIINMLSSNLRVDNSKNITIPGTYGVLQVFFELREKGYKYQPGEIFIEYSGQKLNFSSDNNFVITLDGDLIFARNSGRMFMQGLKKDNDENLMIDINDIKIRYKKKEVTIIKGKKKASGAELGYNEVKSMIYFYENKKLKEKKEF